MPVIQNSILFTNPLDNTPVNWLLANVGDEILITHNISVSTFAIATTNAKMTFNNTDGYFGNDVYNITGGDFSKFNIGDQVSIKNYGQNLDFGVYTVVGKPSNTELILNVPIGSIPGFHAILPLYDNVTPEAVVSLVKPITALVYKYNFIKNSEAVNYFSKVDGSIQIASITGLNPAGGGTNKPMTFLGAKPYQIGSITVDEVGLGTGFAYSSDFVIKHRTRITPVILDTQISDLQNGIAPDYFFNLECLKSVFYFEARYFVNDPNLPQTLEVANILGNTGWFNENWNGNPTNYYIENLQYGYAAAPVPPATIGVNVAIPGVELSIIRDTKFIFDIRNVIDNPFVAGSTSLVLNFCKVPNGFNEYTANNRDLKHNFVWDSVEVIVQTTPTGINGDNYADLTIRSLASVKAHYVNNNKITISGRFDFDQQGIDVFEESDTPTYLFFVSIQDHAKNGPISDRVTLKVDSGDIWYQTSFPDLIKMDSKLIPHDVANYTDAYIDRDKFTEDELVAYTSAIVGEDPAVTNIQLIKYTAKLLAINPSITSEFLLDSKSVSLPATPLLSGRQVFNITQARQFHIPVAEIRKNIIARTLPGSLRSNYEFAYPFLNRWEYWLALIGVDSFFYNPVEANNGWNEDWRHYSRNGWLLQYRFELNTKINGIPAIYSDTLDFPVLDRNLVGENTTCIIKTYDPDTSTELVDSTGKKYVLGYKNTLVEAEFTNLTDNFEFNDTTVVLGIEVYEQGGHYGKRRISTKYTPDADTWFIPLTGQTKAKLDYINTATPPLNIFGKVKASALLDFNSLNAVGLKYKLTARVYGNTLSSPITGIISYGNNYLGDQNVGLIPNNPIDEDTQVVEPAKLDCCSDNVWRVLADVSSADPLKNDQNNFIWWFDKDATATAVLSLVSSDGTIRSLTGVNTYGTPYDFGFEIMPSVTVNGYNEKAVGYFIDWRKVITTLGEDTYYVQCDITTIFGASQSIYSDTYCLKQYTLARADGTIRVEYFINGILGKNENDTKSRDYLKSNWYNQHRFDGVFHFVDGQYKEDEIQYQSGLIENVEHGQTPEYILKLRSIPMFKHNVLRTDFLMADKKYITDYNTKNIENYYKKEVKCVGNYEPKFNVLLSKLASVELKFKQAVNNLNKYIS